jgi:hypothetical protein
MRTPADTARPTSATELVRGTFAGSGQGPWRWFFIIGGSPCVVAEEYSADRLHHVRPGNGNDGCCHAKWGAGWAS